MDGIGVLQSHLCILPIEYYTGSVVCPPQQQIHTLRQMPSTFYYDRYYNINACLGKRSFDAFNILHQIKIDIGGNALYCVQQAINTELKRRKIFTQKHKMPNEKLCYFHNWILIYQFRISCSKIFEYSK